MRGSNDRIPEVTHRSGGLYRVLAVPRVYEGFQKILGARAARKRFTGEFLRPWSGARLLDVGCGTGSLIDDLPAGVEYVGFDVNASYIDAARRRYGDRGTFHCAAAGEEPAAVAGQFDFVVAKSVLHHLTDADADHVIGMARHVLRAGGVLITSDCVLYEGQPWISKALAKLDRGGRVRTPDGYRRLVERHFGNIETRLVTDMLPIPYAHFIMRAQA
jgi:2-polyprenyl-3-methyl-5-hydroxy-6-metoxy-1,4-benzoquinol methylase